jgi:hypothetical protein
MRLRSQRYESALDAPDKRDGRDSAWLWLLTGSANIATVIVLCSDLIVDVPVSMRPSRRVRLRAASDLVTGFTIRRLAGRFALPFPSLVFLPF